MLINIAEDDINVEAKAVTNHTNTKKWFLLAVAATALLVIPRRSSRKADTKPLDKQNVKDSHDIKTEHTVVSSDDINKE